jgi:Tfp pilus assembly protein PilP
MMRPQGEFTRPQPALWALMAGWGLVMGLLCAAPCARAEEVSARVDEAEAVFAPFSPMRRWLAPPRPAPRAAAAPSRLLSEPLESMRYVGFLEAAHGRMALLAVAGEVHVVRVGQRVGLEGARVARVRADALAFEWQVPGGVDGPAAMPSLPFEGDRP